MRPFLALLAAPQVGAGHSIGQVSVREGSSADTVIGVLGVEAPITTGHANLRGSSLPSLPPATPLTSDMPGLPPIPTKSEVPTPVRVGQLSRYLAGYNAKKARFLLLGFTHGFRLQYHGKREFRDARNLKSAFDLPQVLKHEISLELQSGRVSGPFLLPPFPNLQVSPLGLVAKKEPNTYRVIHHLSFPEGNSINDGISSDDASVQYQRVDDAINLILSTGVGSLMAKTDIEKAFRILPVHPVDYELLGMKINNLFYYDKALPMGCSISCKLFEEFSTALHWILANEFKAAAVVHVLDDFLFIGAAGTQQCEHALYSFIKMCSDINIPIKHSKTVNPCTVITFLGIELDSVKMESRLPRDKVEKIKTLLNEFMGLQKVTLKQLQSLLGVLNFACRVVIPGRPFLRRLIDLTRGVHKPHHHLRLNHEAKADVAAWKLFIDTFNGSYMFSSMI